MIDLIKTHKGLAFSLIGTILIILTLSYLTFDKRTEVSDCEVLLAEQVDRLTLILDKEFSVDKKALELAKSNNESVAKEYRQLIKELSVYTIPEVKMTATRFKAMLQDKLISLGSKIKKAGIEVNRSKIPSLSLKDLTDKKESSYKESDFTKGSQKIAIISRLTNILVNAKVSKIEFLSWHEVEGQEKSSFVSALNFELTVTGTQKSIEDMVNSLSSDQRVLFFVKSMECQNSTTLMKPAVNKGKEVDLSSKESREIQKENQITCKLYVKVLQFNLVESKEE